MTYDVGAAGEFEEGRVRVVLVAGRQVGVVRWNDGWYAVRNICPHASGPLCLGPIGPRLVSDAIGTVDVDPTAPVLTCPWHAWEFDVRTGESVTEGRAYRVATYPVMLAGDRVLVELRTRP